MVENIKKYFDKDLAEAQSGDKIYDDYYSIPSFEANLTGILTYYSEAAYACYYNGYFEKASQIMKSMDALYNSVPSELAVRYKRGSEVVSKNIKILKEANSYYTAYGSYIIAMGNRGRKNYYDNENVTYEELKKHIDKFEKEVNEIPREGEKTDDSLLMNLIVVKSFVTSYSKLPVFKESYFAQPEDIRIPAEKIVDPYERVVLKIVTDRQYSTSNMVSFKMEFKSDVSKRSKILCLRPNVFFGQGYDYYAAFLPNEDKEGNDKTKNLIKKHGNGEDMFKNSVSIADGAFRYLQEGSEVPDNPFKTVKDSKFFQAIIGEAVARKRPNDPITTVAIDKNTIEAMGHELIVTEPANNFQILPLRVRNQADWYYIDSHGEPVAIKIQLDSGVDYYYIDDFVFNNTNTKGVFFGGCNQLKISFSIINNVVVLNKNESSPGIKYMNKMGIQTMLFGYRDYSTSMSLIPFNSTINDLDDLYEVNPGYPDYNIRFKVRAIKSWMNNHKRHYIKLINEFADKHGSNPTNSIPIDAEYDKIQMVKNSCVIYNNKYYYYKELSNKIVIGKKTPMDLSIESIKLPNN